MIFINNYNDFIFESYGENKLVDKLSNLLFKIINDNLGKLILNKELSFSSCLGSIEYNTQNDTPEFIHFINDKINIKLSDRTYGSINVSTIDIQGEYVLNMDMNLEIQISKSEFNSKSIYKSNKLINTINHEFLHVIELFLTKKNERKISKSWEKGENLQKLIKKYPFSKNWQDVSYLIYLSLPHEMRSKLQEFNSLLKNIDKKVDMIEFIKNTKTYKDTEFLSKINEHNIINKLKLDKDYDNIIKDINNILFDKDSNYEKNILGYFKSMKVKNTKLLDKLLKSYNNVINYTMEEKDINYNDYLEN